MTMAIAEPVGAERAALEAKRGLAAAQRLYAVDNVEVRAAENADSTIVDFYGHASVTDKGYEMYGGPDNGGWIEYVDKGSFKRTLDANPDVVFKVNHDGLPLARTERGAKPGNLWLAEDVVGLETKAKLDKRINLVNDIVLLMESHVLDEMSFAFRIMKQRWLDKDGAEVPWWDMTGVERHITEVSLQKGDVSIVTYGASPHTDGGVRSLAETLRMLKPEECKASDLRSAVDFLRGLMPAADMPHDYTDDGEGMCAMCGLTADVHDLLMPAEKSAVHPDLVAASHAALKRRAELRGVVLL